MNLNNLFTDFFSRHFGPLATPKCLLTVSGGVDSMVMLELFRQANANIGVAHCNFTLRGRESDLDHELVKEYCGQYQIPFHEQRFDTAMYAVQHDMSIQMAARELRYKWFAELALRNAYTVIATAHHQDDNAETLLLNLIRGTGLNGLSGIPLKNGNIIRPLLFATKEQLQAFAELHQVPFRNDASNIENKYARNKLRNEVLPLLLQINPQTIAHLNALSQYAGAAYTILQQHIDEIRHKHLSIINDRVHIDMRNVMITEHPSLIVFELLKEFGFNAAQVDDIIGSFSKGNTGSSFFSNSHLLIVDRDEAVITLNNREHEVQEMKIANHAEKQIAMGNRTYVFEYLPAKQLHTFEPGHIYLDASSIPLPYTIRKWKHGDRFKPMGLNGMKKISDFLIDERINIIDKESILVLECAGKIAAILNHRISEEFKITPHTKEVLHIYIL